MFVKNRKRRPWIFCLIAALLLALGIGAFEISDQRENTQGVFTGKIYETANSQGFFAGKIYETIVTETESEWSTEAVTALEEEIKAETQGTELVTPLVEESEAEMQGTELAMSPEEDSEAETRGTKLATPPEEDSEAETQGTELATPLEEDSENHDRNTEALTSLYDKSERDSEDTEVIRNTEALAETEPKNGNTGTKSSQIFRIAAGLLLALGIFLAALAIFQMRQACPCLGPEAELFLLFLCIWMLPQPMSPVGLGRMLSLWLLFFLLLISLRGLWGWLREGFSSEWSAAHRLGMRLVGNSKKRSRYLKIQFLWTILALSGSTFLLVAAIGELFDLPYRILFGFYVRGEIFMLLEGAVFLMMALLSAYRFWKAAGDVDHLSEQISHLHAGEPISVQKGVFSAEEEKLIDLDHQRDEAIHTAVTSERFKVDLISNVSHDLRTPLTAILGYGELLKGESLSSDGEKQLEELNRKAGYMYELVESLFELTKVSSGVVESKKEQIDLIRLLEQTIGLFDDELKKHNLEVRRHYESERVILVTDGARMHQVFANLIGNAIKYTLPGTRIHLEVRCTGGEYTIRMINIAAYEMDFDADEILERFARGDKARSTKGSGLGLAIAKTYTESVGGDFRVLIDGEQFSAIVTLPQN